jgi:hypothetical protein
MTGGSPYTELISATVVLSDSGIRFHSRRNESHCTVFVRSKRTCCTRATVFQYFPPFLPTLGGGKLMTRIASNSLACGVGSGMNGDSQTLDISGAGNGTRTRDPLLGKQMLYQLSYSRSSHSYLLQDIL